MRFILPNIDSSITYKIEITNNTDIIYIIDGINELINSNELMTYTIENIDKDILNKQVTTFNITIKYKDTVTEVPSNNIGVFELKLNLKIKDVTPPILTINESGYNNFNDGAVIYYDVLTGKPCNNYHIDNSKTNYNGTTDKKTTDNQNSCLKFYAFNDDEGDTTVNLLLDHNTTDGIVWGTNGSMFGPDETIAQLKIDTDEWIGTITPENYTVSSYTIDYSNYKARLITANEIAEITGNTSFDENDTKEGDEFYFDTNTTSSSSTHNYGWLYDRTSFDCEDYGCLNNTEFDYGMDGYWTSTEAFGDGNSIWYITYKGSMEGIIGRSIYMRYFTTTDYGVRPVIEVLKSNLEKQININAYDNESGLSSDNNYQYYLSTSNTTLENGTWTNYTIGKSITINQDKTLYLWLYPIKDNAGNVNDNKVFNTPYVTKKLEKTYIITYDLNGGTLSSSNPSTYTNETSTFTLTNPTKPGYTFTGWTGSNGTTPSTKVTIEKDSIGNKNYIANYQGLYKFYANGEIVYYDVLNGSRCTNYHVDNSKTGYNGVSTSTSNQNSCLKFYAFNDDEGDSKINLLLDHNTTAQVYWTDSSTESITSGPINVIEQLKTDTSSWLGTMTPENYTVSQSMGPSYVIDYSDYKARLITANEIAKITGNTTFNESTSTTIFYFDTNTTSESTTCTYGNTTGCSYGWLYDRTNSSCTTHGCLNNGDSEAKSYWTSTSAPVNITRYFIFDSKYDKAVWYVNYYGYLYFNNVNDNSLGIRPVIEVLKSNLQ